MNDLSNINFKELVYRGIESEQLDYKAAQDWNKLNRVGKSKFVRHCLAMANTKGGVIIVGVKENSAGNPCIYTGLTEKEAKGFDPTPVGEFINRFADPAIQFDLARPVVDGKTYAIFIIHRFETIPHVCGYGCASELQQGVFYIRTENASSRPAYRASEMHAIVQRALRNQRESLGRMLRGILYENQNAGNPDEYEYYFNELLKDSRNAINKNKKHSDNIYCDISVYPKECIKDKFSLSELKNTTKHILCTNRKLQFIKLTDIDTGFSTNTSFRFFSNDDLRYWQVFRSGLLHWSYEIDTVKQIEYDSIIQICTESLSFISQYFIDLGYEGELFDINITMKNVQNAQIANFLPSEKAFICQIPEIKIQMERNMIDLSNGIIKHSERMIKEICERFNLSAGRHNDLLIRLKQQLEE